MVHLLLFIVTFLDSRASQLYHPAPNTERVRIKNQKRDIKLEGTSIIKI